MAKCDYCDEALPLWHRREGDEMEPDQFVPCTLSVTDDALLNLIARMIAFGFTREDVALVRDLANGRIV